MRWMRFEHDGSVNVGKVEDGHVQPVAAGDLQEVMRGVQTEPVGEPVPIDEVRVLAPLRPSKVIVIGNNYVDHIREQGIEFPDHPALLAKFPTSVIGHGQEVRWPEKLTRQVDYEAELAVVVGREAKALTEEDALGAVFGYTAANEISARDVQMGDGGHWVRGKAFDNFCPIGPTITTADEVPDPQKLTIRCILNGEVVQDSTTAQMYFSVAQLLAFVSEGITLEPGDVILTGTPPGVGYFRDPQVFLQPGDTVEVEIEGIDALSNPVGDYL